MKAQLDWQAYRNLEFGTQQNAPKTTQTARTGLREIWQMLLAHLAATSEPKVWQTQDETGKTVWSVYDPRTGRSIHQVSSDRAREWLRL